ncbi:MAG: tail fiber domain-containing protein [Bacteroidales bacterium]|nr:tail fiber domain-containing protein [Bacteroidales bacterium]
MKKFTLALSLVLGLCSISATQAQMRVYNKNLVKFGNVNTSPTLSRGLEVAMDNFLFKGQTVQFNFNGDILEIKGNLGVSPASAPSSDSPNIVGPYGDNATIFISAPNNRLSIGKSAQMLHSIYAQTVNYVTLAKISDRRYKTNIMDLEPVMDKIMRLHPVKFDYLAEKDGERSADPRQLNRTGFIAQELQEVIPEAVYYMETDDIYTVDYTVLIPFLIKTVQEQQTQIEELQNKIDALSTVK